VAKTVSAHSDNRVITGLSGRTQRDISDRPRVGEQRINHVPQSRLRCSPSSVELVAGAVLLSWVGCAADGFEDSTVGPLNRPIQGGVFDIVDMPPRASGADEVGCVDADCGKLLKETGAHIPQYGRPSQ
jgi:hypothetical protein